MVICFSGTLAFHTFGERAEQFNDGINIGDVLTAKDVQVNDNFSVNTAQMVSSTKVKVNDEALDVLKRLKSWWSKK